MLTDTNLPDVSRSDTATVTTATARPEHDPHALLAEVVLRLEFAGVLPRGRRIPDPIRARDAAEALVVALGLTPVDLDMGRRIAKRVAALAGDPR